MARTKQEAREILGGKTVARNSTISANQTVSELRQRAKERGIDLKGITKKADILKALGASPPKAPPKAKAKKAPPKAKKAVTRGDESDLLKQARDAIKARNEFIEAFKVKYKEELDQLPEGTLFLDAVWYLSGVDLKGDLGKPPKKVISSKLRDVVMDLIPRNLVAAIRVFPS